MRIALSLQFIKPSLAKIVYTIGETMYSPFRFSRKEYESGEADGIIRDAVTKHIATQVSSLVATAQEAFNPKDVAAKLVGKDGAFYVADQRVEAGSSRASRWKRMMRPARRASSTSCTRTAAMRC